MKISREDIIRMVGDRAGGSSGGGGDANLSGAASMAWVNQSFIGIDYFNQLFETTVRVVVTDTSTTPATLISDISRVLAPNEVAVASATTTDEETGHTIVTTMTITGIQVKSGLWSNSYISALGQSTGGGGGGGVTLNEPLASINNASLGSPTQSGQVITWNGSAWVYDIPSGGGGSSTLYGLTDVNISSPTNGQALVYNATSQRWENQTIGGGGGGGTLTSIGLIMPTGFAVSPSTLMADGDFTVSFATGYGLPLTADVAKGVTAYGWGNHANAGYLMESTFNNYLFWGQSINNGVVQGSIDAGTNGGAITGFHSIELNTEGTLSGYGGFIDFHYNGALSDYTARIIEASPGVVRIYDKLQIGDAVIEWDSTNNAIYVQRSDGSAVNLYATGGVSALGMSAGTSSVDAMTFNYVTINNRLRVKGSGSTHSIYGDSNGYLVLSGDEGIIFDNDTKINGYNLIITDGYVKSPKYYLDSTSYLYVSSGTLYYYNGSTSKQVAFTN